MQIIKRITRKTMMLRALGDGEMMPRWYGLAYFDLAMMEYVTAPIPLNILLAWLNKLYYWLQCPVRQPHQSMHGMRIGYLEQSLKKAEEKLAHIESIHEMSIGWTKNNHGEEMGKLHSRLKRHTAEAQKREGDMKNRLSDEIVKWRQLAQQEAPDEQGNE